jgi:hypothetical protein
VKGLQDYYDPYLFVDEKDSDGVHIEKIKKFNSSTPVHRNELWERKLKDFLMDSKETWILDQYNLIKLFLFQNSWDAEK